MMTKKFLKPVWNESVSGFGNICVTTVNSTAGCHVLIIVCCIVFDLRQLTTLLAVIDPSIMFVSVSFDNLAMAEKLRTFLHPPSERLHGLHTWTTEFGFCF